MKSVFNKFTCCTILSTLILLSFCSQAQDFAKVSKGSISIGAHLVCPQNQLSDIGYDDGIGMQLSYLSKKYPYKSKVNYQLGIQFDWGNMGQKSYSDIELVDPTIIGDGTIKVKNNMYGGFLIGRINYGRDNDKIVPYINLILGHRNFNTRQTLSLENPTSNPDYQTDTTTNKIVFTKRFHYGGGFGLNCRLTEHISVDAGVTYSKGSTGAVLPLKNITRPNEGNEINYKDYRYSSTDVLLINFALRFSLFKTYTYRPYVFRHNKSILAPSYTRYTDNTRTNNTSRNRNNPNPPTSNKKTPIKIKPNGPSKDKKDES